MELWHQHSLLSMLSYVVSTGNNHILHTVSKYLPMSFLLTVHQSFLLSKFSTLNFINQLKFYYCSLRCWISDKEGAIWAFLGPMLFIILVRLIITIPKLICRAMIIIELHSYMCLHIYTIGITFSLQINSTVYIIIVHQVFKTKHDAKTVDKADTVESVK